MVVDTKKPAQIHIKREISFEELHNCISLDCLEIDAMKTFDFLSFDRILRERKRDQFKTEQEFQDYKKEILNSTKNGTCDLPRISVKGKRWNILDGKIRLLAFKVLGINPVVEFFSVK